jgi:hypothetical protein
MDKWCMKLIRKLLFSFFVYRKVIGPKVDYLKYRIDLLDWLVFKFMQHEMSGHHGGDNTIKRLVVCYVTRRILSTEWKAKKIVCSRHDKSRETVYFCQFVILLWGWRGLTTQRNISEVM